MFLCVTTGLLLFLLIKGISDIVLQFFYQFIYFTEIKVACRTCSLGFSFLHISDDHSNLEILYLP